MFCPSPSPQRRDPSSTEFSTVFILSLLTSTPLNLYLSGLSYALSCWPPVGTLLGWRRTLLGVRQQTVGHGSRPPRGRLRVVTNLASHHLRVGTRVSRLLPSVPARVDHSAPSGAPGCLDGPRTSRRDGSGPEVFGRRFCHPTHTWHDVPTQKRVRSSWQWGQVWGGGRIWTKKDV